MEQKVKIGGNIEDLHSLPLRMKKILSNPKSDVTFTFQDKTSIQAHKIILASASPVFQAMFSNGMQESISTSIELLDIDKNIFSLLIEFLYTGECCVEVDSVLDLLFCSHRYQCTELELKCCNLLKEHIDDSNIGTIYEITLAHQIEDLKLKCIEYISEKTDLFLKSSIKDVSKLTLMHLLKCDDILQTDEYNIWEGICFWAQSQVNEGSDNPGIKSLLEDIIPLVRFPLMSISGLEKVCDQKLVPAEALLEAYRHKVQLDLIGKSKFTVVPRKFNQLTFCAWDKEYSHSGIIVNDKIITSSGSCIAKNILVLGNICGRSKFSFKLLNHSSCYEAYGIVQLADFKVEGFLERWIWHGYPGRHNPNYTEFRKGLDEGRITAQSVISIVYDPSKKKGSVFVNGLKKNQFENVIGKNLRFVVTLCHATQIEIVPD
jgi:hypothetical protein